MGKKTSIYLSEKLESLIEKYKRLGGPGEALTALADRYDTITSIGKRKIRNKFSTDEIMMLVYQGLSTVYEPAGVIPGAILADIEDMDPNDFKSRKIDRAALLEKLRTLTIDEQFALVDWLEELRPRSQ